MPMLARMFGLRMSRKAQTTAEYAIIVALVAVASIAVILLFGNQIRSLFAAETERLGSDSTVNVNTDAASSADDAREGSITNF